MKSELSTHQLISYQEDGYLLVEGFLDPTELERWRRVTNDAVAGRLSDPAAELTNQKNPQDYYARVFTQAIRLADTHAEMRTLIFDPPLARMAAMLAGADGMRLWHDQALIKPPWGNPTGWHLDNPYWSFSSPQAISFWIALDDATLANGCMWYLPGTHKTARYDNVGIGQNISDLFGHYPQWRQIEAVPAPCPAGSVVWHSGLIAHAAGVNMTPRPRRAMTCAFMPDGATFNGKKNILPQRLMQRLQPGDLLNDDQQTPLLWHRSWEQQ